MNLLKILTVYCFLFTPLTASALELSGGISLPSGGILNSLYISGSPVQGVTIKAHLDNDWEYTGFLGGAVLVSLEKLFFLNPRVYTLVGGSLPLALNVGGGIYLSRTEFLGLRLQYTSLVTTGGTILGSNTGGPFTISWLGLLLCWNLK